MLEWWQLLIFYSYGIPIFVINLTTVFMLIIKYEQFNKSYDRLFLICAANDCTLYFFNNIVIRLPLFKPLYDVFYSKFGEFNYYPTIPMTIVLFGSYFTNFGTFLLSLNRMTAIWKYNSHEKIWKIAGLWLVLLSCLGAFIFSFQTLGNNYQYTMTEIQNVSFVLVRSENKFVLWNNEHAAPIVVGVFTFLGLAVNTITFILWRQRKNFIPSKFHDYERRLILLTVVIYSLHLLSFLFNSFEDKIFTDLMQIYIAYIIVSDMISLIPTLAILVASQALRVEIFPSCAGSNRIGTDNEKVLKKRAPMTVTAMPTSNDY